MSYVKLNFPILVEPQRSDQQDQYRLSPLLVEYPAAYGRRFEPALNQLKKEIKFLLKGFEVNRESAEQLMWFMFNPPVELMELPVNGLAGNQSVRAPFSVVTFTVGQHLIVCLPAFERYLFLMPADMRRPADIRREASSRILHLLKEARKNDPDGFDVGEFQHIKGTFITNLSLGVQVDYAPFHFEQSGPDWLFSQVQGGDDFNGAVEIEKIGTDLNSLYPAELDRAFFREQLSQRLYRIIYQQENNPIVIVGPEGVGKHSLIQEVVYQYMEKERSDNELHDQKIWQVDPTRLIAGMMYVGWWQKRAEAILDYVMHRHQKMNKESTAADKILIDNPIAVLRVGKTGQNDMTLADLLKPYLEKRQLQLILLASPGEWKIVQETDRKFADLFEIIRMPEPAPELAARMIIEKKKLLETTYHCKIYIQAIHMLFNIQRNYLRGQALPGSVMRLLQQLAVKHKSGTIESEEVRQEFEDFSGFKRQIFDNSSVFETDEVKQAIGRELVGQDAATEALSNLVHIIKAKLTTEHKPMGSFLFVGPTGVGKTQAAKVLSNYLMGGPQHILRFDMNEYGDAWALHRLIGDEHNPEGHLTGRVRYQPFAIVLLDEIEKAHEKVHNLLLQVLDDGRLTDSLGRTVDFSNTIIIMTSNEGAEDIQSQVGFGLRSEQAESIYAKALEKRFKPEFLNRIDRIVVFKKLQLEHILRIARLQIKELLHRDGFVRRTTLLNISTEALEWVARRGYDSSMGGRSLKRQIERDLTALSAEQLLKTTSDTPIILDILLQEDRLVPRITPLRFIEPLPDNWMPQLPDPKRGKRFYTNLLRRIERIEQTVLRHENKASSQQDEMIVIGSNSGGELNWQHYDFKERIASIKQRITNLSLGFRDRHFREGPAIPLRLKRGTQHPRYESSTKGARENYRDQLFQMEALREITEGYEHGLDQFDSLETEFIDNFVDVAFLELYTHDFLRERSEVLYLEFQSSINGSGQQEIDFLIEHYQDLLTHLEIEHAVDPDQNRIRVEGFALHRLLQGEQGIHLFYRSHQNPLPIRLEITQPGNTQSADSKPLKVIRIYDGNATLTDLRTGFSNAINISAPEFKLLLYAGLPR